MGFAGTWYCFLFVHKFLTLIACFIAGGGTYYLAKRSIRAERKARHEADLKFRHSKESLDSGSQYTKENSLRNAKEKGDYEASIPFRSKKGDRFS